MTLLFVPLDVNIPENSEFRLGDLHTSIRQHYWNTRTILGRENNYEEYKWLFDQLPFSYVDIFTYKVQKQEVGQHLDHDIKKSTQEKIDLINSTEPSGYHIVLKGRNNTLEIYDGVDWITPILPEAPYAYALGLVTCLHRVREDTERTTLYIEGTLDIEKHKLLIERSVQKYKDLAIYSKN
jgi:hypothetical protein